MDNKEKERLEKAMAAEGPAPADLSPEQATGQFVNVQAEELAETSIAGLDATRAQGEPEHLEDRVKTLSPAALVAKRFFRSKLSMVGLVTLIVLFLFSFLGPVIYNKWDQNEADRSGMSLEDIRVVNYVDSEGNAQQAYEYMVATSDSLNSNALPGGDHILGTDENGYDVFSRLMYGGRISLTLGFVVVILQSLFGVVLGGLAGYFGKWVDMLIMRIADIFACIPTLPIMLIISFVLQGRQVDAMTRLYVILAMLSLLGWAGVARMVRGQILSLREQEFMMAAEATGLSFGRKLFRHLLPNVLPQLIVSMTLGLGNVILTEATLGYLGLGVPAEYATWGNMINVLTKPVGVWGQYPFQWVPTGICIVLAVLAFNFVGDGLRDAFDPKMKR